MSTTPCEAFSPHLWKAGLCRECQQPEAAHKNNPNKSSASITAEKVTKVGELARAFGGAMSSKTPSPVTSTSNSAVNSPRIQPAAASVAHSIPPMTANKATVTPTSSSPSTTASTVNKPTTPAVATPAPTPATTTTTTTFPAATVAPSASSPPSATATSSEQLKKTSSPSTPTTTACSKFEPHKFLPNKCINCPLPKSEHAELANPTASSPAKTESPVRTTNPVASSIAASIASRVAPVNTEPSETIKASVASPVMKNAPANIANIFKQSPRPTVDTVTSPPKPVAGSIADRMSGLKLFSPTNMPNLTPKREVTVPTEQNDSSESASLSTPTSGGARRAKMTTPRSRPSRPSFTPLKTPPAEVLPIQVVGPSVSSESTTESASQESEDLETSAKDPNDTSQQTNTEDGAASDDATTTDSGHTEESDNASREKESGPVESTSAAVNFFTDGFKVEKKTVEPQSAPKVVESTQVQANTSQSAPSLTSAAKVDLVSTNSPVFSENTSNNSSSSSQKADNVSHHALLNDDYDDNLFLPSTAKTFTPINSIQPNSLSALTKNVDFLDFERPVMQEEDDDDIEQGPKQITSAQPERQNSIKPATPPSTTAANARLFFSPLSSDLPKGLDDVPIKPASAASKPSTVAPPPAATTTKSQPLFFARQTSTEQKALMADQTERSVAFSPNSHKSSTPSETPAESTSRPVLSSTPAVQSIADDDDSSSNSLFNRPAVASSAVLADVLGVQVDTRPSSLFD